MLEDSSEEGKMHLYRRAQGSAEEGIIVRKGIFLHGGRVEPESHL